MFDYSGLAALVAIPASIFGAIWGARRIRGLEDRIERLIDLIERMPEKSAEREALEDARDMLAERLVVRLFNFRPGPVLGLYGITAVYLGGAIIWRSIDPTADRDPLWDVIFWLGLITFVVAIVLSIVFIRGRWRNEASLRRTLDGRREYWSLNDRERRRVDREHDAAERREKRELSAAPPRTPTPKRGARRRSP